MIMIDTVIIIVLNHVTCLAGISANFAHSVYKHREVYKDIHRPVCGLYGPSLTSVSLQVMICDNSYSTQCYMHERILYDDGQAGLSNGLFSAQR